MPHGTTGHDAQVTSQLKCSGVLESLKIRKAG
jgi:myosin heavy subunit